MKTRLFLTHNSSTNVLPENTRSLWLVQMDHTIDSQTNKRPRLNSYFPNKIINPLKRQTRSLRSVDTYPNHLKIL